MKRSSMLSLIMCYVEERNGNGPLAHLNDEEFSDYLLMKIEEQGMLPALTNDFYWKIGTDGYNKLINDWEKNET